MNRFRLEQLRDLLEIYIQNKENWSEIARQYRTKYGSREGPTVLAICKFTACLIGNSENLDVVLQKLMHLLRVTVWCSLWRGGIIGPYFFENE